MFLPIYPNVFMFNISKYLIAQRLSRPFLMKIETTKQIFISKYKMWLIKYSPALFKTELIYTSHVLRNLMA